MCSRSILLTGATGFLGRALLQHLINTGNSSIAITTRSDQDCESLAVRKYNIPAIDGYTVWDQVFQSQIDVVVHAAARAHVMREVVLDPLFEFRQINVEGTLNLARCAAAAGVKRFIFISSIKVNGEETTLGKRYKPDDIPAPLDPYGRSKMEAEAGLRALAVETGMEVVIIRPVLIYGPGVKANFLSLMQWLSIGIPLPLGAIRNSRSLVSTDNLIDFVETCIVHPRAANEIFLVSDGEDVSTPELLKRLATAMGKPLRLFPVPLWLLMAVAKISRKEKMVKRVVGSLEVDISKNFDLLGWRPQVVMRDALSKTVKSFLELRKR
ncbi:MULTISPECIES: UDP-glucose 4-epimerase family protein [Pseudomonas]|uniref:UDP-glucose 4-epimerase family protein n=1 Tax=Pseudomonas TaxID=286 RepID=UPI002362A8BE|nr:MULTISPECIES: SDR family oxidoreductase [Pseudomonas]WJV24872.1 SDR family oxidoreductase [Pseudomonas chlororaphis]